jgi:hypothetical protein
MRDITTATPCSKQLTVLSGTFITRNIFPKGRGLNSFKGETE